MLQKMQLSTTNSFDGYETIEYLGLVYESIVVGTNLFSDFFGSITFSVGLDKAVTKYRESRASEYLKLIA